MKTDPDTLDRTLYIVVGPALIAMAAASVVGMWGYRGVVPLMRATAGKYTLCSLRRINTCTTSR